MKDEEPPADKEAVKPKPKPLKWIGPSKEDLKAFPKEVQKPMGYALHLAQINLKAKRQTAAGIWRGEHTRSCGRS